jgi:hypothetical protein
MLSGRNIRKILGGIDTKVGRTEINTKTARDNSGSKTTANKINMTYKTSFSESKTKKFKRNARTRIREGGEKAYHLLTKRLHWIRHGGDDDDEGRSKMAIEE